MTLNNPYPQFQGHAIFWGAEYLRNGTTYRYIIEILIGTYTRPAQQCHFEWSWVILSDKCIGDDTKAAARQSPNCIKIAKKICSEKRFSIWRMELLHPAMWHDHDIDFARWLHSAMWHVALESWQWIHQMWYMALGRHAVAFAGGSILRCDT